MTIHYRQNGIGSTSGNILTTCSPLMTRGAVWYVDSTNGVDTNDGNDRRCPLKTIGQAYSSSSAYDTIVLMNGFSETRATTLSIAKNITIVGEGSSSGNPTAILSRSMTGSLFSVTTAVKFFSLINIRFNDTPASSTAPMVYWIGNATYDEHLVVDGCYFYSTTSNESLYCQALGSVFIKNTTFYAYDATIRSVYLSAPGTVNSTYRMQGITAIRESNSGTYGYNNIYVLGNGSTYLWLEIDGITLSNGADVYINNCLGWVAIDSATGSSDVYWSPPTGVDVKMYPGGIGESLGHNLVTKKRLLTTSAVYYVHKDGLDANNGLTRSIPKKTLSSAYTAAPALSIIVLLDGHSEPISTAIAVSKDMTIVGAGLNGGYPSAELILSAGGGATPMFDITGATGYRLFVYNVHFNGNVNANTSDFFSYTDGTQLAINELYMDGCLATLDANSNGMFVDFIGESLYITNTKIEYTALGNVQAINYVYSYASGPGVVYLDSLIVSGKAPTGTYSVYISGTGGSADVLLATRVSLLLGSGIYLKNIYGYLNVGTESQDSLVVWAD